MKQRMKINGTICSFDLAWQFWRNTWMSAGLAVFIAGCASTPPAPVEDRTVSRPIPSASSSSSRIADTSSSYKGTTYRVVEGDTLYAIAFKRGLDYLDIARWNNINPPYRIYVGQELLLSDDNGSKSVVNSRVEETPSSSRTSSAPTKPTDSSSAATVDSNEHSNASVFEFVEDQTTSPDASSSKSQELSTSKTDASPTVKPKNPAFSPASNTSEASSTTVEENQEPEPITSKHEAPKSVASTSNAGGINWRWPSSGPKLNGFVTGDQVRQGIDIGGRAGDPVLAAADGTVVYSGNGLLGYGELIIIKHNSTFLSAYGYNRKRLVQEGDTVKAGQAVAEMGSNGASREMLHFEIRKNGKPVNPMEYLPGR